MSGVFITFEGGEGAGKTTLMEAIAHALSARHKVLKTREPGGTLLGERIREILLHHKEPFSPYAELALFLASRAQHVEETILPALRAHKVVLCDRFHDSTIAYQGAARGLGVDEVEAFCKFTTRSLEPDLTLYLDIDPEEGLARAKKARVQDRMEAQKLVFHRKVREAYLVLHQKFPKRIHLLDASSPQEKVFDTALRWVEHVLR